MTWTDLGPNADMGTFLRTISVVTPTGTSADAANIQAALTAMAGVGEVRLKPGTFVISTKLTVPANSIIVHHPNTILSSSLADSGLGGGGFLSSVYYANAAAVGSDTTLSTASVAGDPSIACTAIPGSYNTTTIVGKTIIFGNLTNNVVQQAKVLSASGSGPYTLVLDEVVQYDVATSGSTVGVRTVPSGIVLVGNGSIITGTGDRAIELGFARSCLVDGFRITRDTNSFVACAVSLDTGSVDSVIRNVHVDGGGTTHFMFGLESTVRCKLIDSSARFGGTAVGACGIYMASTRATEVRGVEVQKAKFGILVGADGTDDKGCRRSQIRSASLIQCSDDGIAIFGGSRDLEIDGANILKPGRYGIYVYVGSALSPERVKITNSTIDTATTNGLRVINAAKVEVDNVSIVSSGVGVYQANTAEIKGGRLTVSGGTLSVDVVAGTLDLACLETTDATTDAHVRVRGGAYVHLGHWACVDASAMATTKGLLDFEGASTLVKIDGGYMTVANAGTIYGMISVNGGSGCKAIVRNFNAGRTSGTGGIAYYAISTVLFDLDHVSTSGAWAYGCYAVDQTCRFRFGAGCDMSSASTPHGFSGSGSTAGQYNFGTVALNGATPVDVFWGPLLSTDTVILARTTSGGTPNLNPLVTKTAGTKFTVTGVALDTSTYSWKVL